MKECDKIKLMLSSYVDNEVSEEEKVVLNSHLNKCSDCMKYLEETKKIQRLFLVEKLEPPPFLESRVLQRIKEENTGIQFIIRKLVPVLASILIIVASVYFLFARKNSEMIDEYISDDSLEVEIYEE